MQQDERWLRLGLPTRETEWMWIINDPSPKEVTLLNDPICGLCLDQSTALLLETKTEVLSHKPPTEKELNEKVATIPSNPFFRVWGREY